MNKQKSLFTLCFCTIMIALGTVLSMIKIWQMPLGGSVTLCAMLPMMMVSYFCGVWRGLISSAVFAMIQAGLSLANVLGWGLTPVTVVACIMLDYFVPYLVLGLCGVFRKEEVSTASHLVRFALGMVLVAALRFISHVISGAVLFSNWAAFQPAWLYSICYNGAFLLPELIICIVVGLSLFTPIRKLFYRFAKQR